MAFRHQFAARHLLQALGEVGFVLRREEWCGQGWGGNDSGFWRILLRGSGWAEASSSAFVVSCSVHFHFILQGKSTKSIGQGEGVFGRAGF